MKISYNTIGTTLISLILFILVVNISILPLFFPIPASLIQAVFYSTLLAILLSFNKGIYIEPMMMLIVVAILLSIAFSEASSRYNIEIRFALFLLLLASIGPLLYSPLLILFRYRLLDLLMIVFMFLSTMSFLYWLIGIPSLGRGHFSGLFNHSMLLAPIASIGSIYAFHRFTISYKLKEKIFFIVLSIFNFLDVILAASRGALAGFTLGITVMFFFNNFKYRRLILAIGMACTFLIFTQTTNGNLNRDKNNGLMSELFARGDVNTRAVLWKDRINEFYAHPFFGVGFVAQDDKIDIRKNHSIDGRIEPGSTYLMILSMTGGIGTLAMILFFSKLFISKRFWQLVTMHERYKLALYVFFLVHFISEGYIYSAGSAMSFVFWLLVGATYPYSSMNYHYQSNGKIE